MKPLSPILVSVLLALNLSAATNQTYTVKVQDTSGQPIPGATVDSYVPKPDPMGNRSFKKTITQTTDSNGLVKLEFTTSEWQVVAHKTGLSIGGFHYYEGRIPASAITLGKPLSIAGIVVDDADKPVPDAVVGVSRLCRISKWKNGTRADYINAELTPDLKESLSTRTGPDGRFRLEGFSENDAIDLFVVKKGHTLVLPPREFISPDTMMCRAGQQDVKVKIQAAGAIEGKVLIPSQSFDMSQVFLQAQFMPPQGSFPLSAKVDRDGSFRLEDLPPGEYLIQTRFGTNRFPDWVAQQQRASVRPGQVTRDLKITATHGGVLEVTALATVGKTPFEQARVYATQTEGASDYPVGIGYTITDAKGVGFLRLPPGKYQIGANKDWAQSAPTTVQIVEGQTNRVEIQLTSPKQISGTVRDNQGVPVAGAEVKILPETPITPSATTDSNGQYRFVHPSLVSGNRNLFLMVRLRDRNLAVCRKVEEGTETNDLQLAPALTLSGRIQDESGKPITNAEVQTVFYTDRLGNGFDNDTLPDIDTQGRFKISALPQGWHYGVNVTAEGYGSADIKREAPSTNDLELGPITLPIADRKVSGVVVDADDKPVVGVDVHVSGTGQPTTRVSTDEKGRFAFRVCQGQVWIRASSTPAANSFRNASARAQAGDTNIVLTLRDQSTSMPIRPPRTSLIGKPLPDLTAAGIPAEALQTNKPLLICIFDPEQRPSRRIVALLGDRYESLKKDLVVLGLFATPTTADALKQWKQSNPVPFPIGGVPEKTDTTKWIRQLEKLPWLILTDPQGRVKAEGFDLDDLDAKLK